MRLITSNEINALQVMRDAGDFPSRAQRQRIAALKQDIKTTLKNSTKASKSLESADDYR